MDFDKFCELIPKAKFVKIKPFEENELTDEILRKENKKPLNSIKEPLDINQAKNWVSRQGRLGWIVPNNMIVIDVDNKDNYKSSEVIKQILENHSIKYWYNNSKQGTHFIFKNISSIMKGHCEFQGHINHIGIQTDGRGDNKGYIILPVNDERFRSWGDYTAEEPDDLPFWLRPLRPRKDTDVSFIDMPDGVGNDALFKLRAAMSGPNLVTQEESIECLRIINTEIWDIPMNEEAFNASVARPVENTYSNMKEQDGTGKENKSSILLKVAEKLIKELKLIAIGDFIYKYEDGVYIKQTDNQIHCLIHRFGLSEATRAAREEIKQYILVSKQIEADKVDTDSGCIPVKNGYLDLYNLKMKTADPELINTVKIEIDYNPNCEFSPVIDDFMKFVASGDPIKMALLYEIAGYCLLRRNKFQKFFIICGNGGTGKSTYCNLIRKMFAGHDQYVSDVALSQFDQDYHLATLLDSMVNIDDDASADKVLRDAGRFKSIVVGNPVLVRQIYSQPIKYWSKSTIIICANEMPKIMDNSEGLYRRLLLVELNNKIEHPDRDFEDKITPLDMEYFFCKACEGIHNVLNRGHFIQEESDSMLKQRFKVQQSSIHRWCQLEHITPSYLINKGLKTIYQEYRLWCLECGYNTFAYGNFIENIISLYNLATEYDRGLKDQIVTSSAQDDEYCPFNLITGGYLK